MNEKVKFKSKDRRAFIREKRKAAEAKRREATFGERVALTSLKHRTDNAEELIWCAAIEGYATKHESAWLNIMKFSRSYRERQRASYILGYD